MAITNLYPNLPGHLVEFKDGGLQLTIDKEAPANAKSLLILGTATDGPINEPVKIDDTTVSQLFGSDVDKNGYPNGATLTKYAKQAFKNGFYDVRCMRITGTQASTEKTFIHKETYNGEPRQTVVSSMLTGSSVTASISGATIYNPQVLNIVPSFNSNLVTLTPSQLITTSASSITIDNLAPGAKLDVKFNGQTLDSVINKETVDVDSTNVSASSVGTVINISEGTLSSDASIKTFAAANDAVGYIEFVDTSSDTVVDINTAIGSNSMTSSPTGFTISDNKINCVINTQYNGYNTSFELTNSVDVAAINEVISLLQPGYKARFVLEYKYAYNDSSLSSSATLESTEDFEVSVPGIITIKSIRYNNETIDVNDFTIEDEKIKYKNSSICKFWVPHKIEITCDVIDTINTEQAFWFNSIYAGEVYNDSTITISQLKDKDGNIIYHDDAKTIPELMFLFTKPEDKRYSEADKPFFLTSVDCPTVGRLKEALNNYALNNVFEINCTDDDMLTVDIHPGAIIDGEYNIDGTNTAIEEFATSVEYQLTGGNNGINPTNDEMYKALSGERNSDGFLTKQGAYQILENYHVDYIYPAGIYADSSQTVNPHSSFHHELALLCAVLTYRTKMTHGFIDVKPNSNTTLVGIQNYVDKLVQYNNNHYMVDNDGNIITDSEGKKMDIGWYTSIVVGPEPVMSSDTLGTYYGSPAIAYAALNSTLKPESAPTNKALPGVKGMKYKFSNKQMNGLVGNRMVVFKLKGEGTSTASSTPYVVDGCTAGNEDCDYRRIATVKVVTDVVDQIREVADPFLGEPNTVEQRNALSALISKRLSYMLTNGEIQYYAFDINATLEQVLLGECTISLTLVVPQELRKITTVVALRATA